MPHPGAPSVPDFLDVFRHITVGDQAAARIAARRQTADVISQSKESITRSRALLERLEAEEKAGWWIGGPPLG